MTPSQYVRKITAQLKAAGDPRRAASSRRFFKQHEAISFYGLSMFDTRRLEREAFKEIKGRWDLHSALDFADQMMAAGRFEAKVVALLTLRRFRTEFDRKLFRVVERWLRENRCDNWAAVDALCPYVITPLVVEFPDLIPRIQRWPRSGNLWVRRAAAVTFVPFARRGELLDTAYDVVESLLADREDLIHKACGWLLREAGTSDRERLGRFLLKHGPAIPRTTVRYAIERFPEAKRKRLLKTTAG